MIMVNLYLFLGVFLDLIITAIAFGLFENEEVSNVLIWTLIGGLLLLSFSTEVRRLQDLGKSWQWVLVELLPFATIPFVIFLLSKAGTSDRKSFKIILNLKHD